MAKNISCRVPWHDNGWCGTVCKNPEKNQACRRCKQIADEILIDKEKECKGRYFNDITDEECESKPCIREGACFMCKDSIDAKVKHPYSSLYDYFKSLEETIETLPSYSYTFTPFRWLGKKLSDTKNDSIDEKTKRYGINYDKKLEDIIFRNIEKQIKDSNKKIELNWVNDGRNQKAIFDYFVDNIKPKESLMFFYSKQVPFIENNNRVLIGVGHALKINELIEYDRESDEGIDSAYLWELMIEHSIRYNSCEDGFIFPFEQILKKQREDLKFDINKAVVLIDDDYFEEFSYKSEIVSFEATIDTLNRIKQALEYNRENDIKFNYGEALNWIEKEIDNAWLYRGEFPGLGNLLCAYGIEGGIKLAEKIKDILKDSTEFWEDFNKLLNENISLINVTKKQENSLEDFLYNEWNNIYNNIDSKYMFDMLSRISFSYDQMCKIVKLLNNNSTLIPEVVNNPYLLYELTIDLDKMDKCKVRLKQLDYAFCKPDNCSFEDKSIINKELRVRGSKDKRRLRAYILDLLVKEADNGNTVYPFKYVINKINDLRLDVECDISEKSILDNKDFYEESGKCIVLLSDENNDEKYFKLKKYEIIDNIIRNFVDININKKNKLEVDWDKKYDEFVKEKSYKSNDDWKEEDVDALKKLANNKFSILTGGAGTGKTSILSILCNEEKIKNGKVLLLAPTGKAAVKMNQSINIESKTLASFLLEAKLYNNGQYVLASNNVQNSFNSYDTIIVDESSMLTEDMLGSLLSYVDTNIDRFILVGDYNQLPPIGAGRPFFDIIQYLKNRGAHKDNVIELFNNKRQIGDNRIDVDFANCFKYENPNAKEFLDVYLMDIYDNKSDLIEFVNSDDGNFDDKIKEELVKATNVKNISKERYMKDIDDIEGFNRSIGKNINDEFFNNEWEGWNNIGDSCGSYADNWQIISPVRGKNIGVQNINSLLHLKYKDEEYTKIHRNKVPLPAGPERIMYGEKVIQVVNNPKGRVFPKDRYSAYLANGEIGITCKWNDGNPKHNTINVEFSHKEGVTYSYYPSEIENEDGSPLELAYALTIHKCQGSQFKNVIAVLKKDCGMLSKELIYTALTRHEDKLFIIGDEDLDFIKDYINNIYSELAKRFTGLFELPDLIQYEDTYYQKGLIQIGDGGQLLRSKSEVIIWNKLYALKDKFTSYYEERIFAGVLPDFVIKNKKGEPKFIWEHLGFTKDKNYMRRWKDKEEIYNKNGFSVEKGNLIITEDKNMAIDSEEINKNIDFILKNIDRM